MNEKLYPLGDFDDIDKHLILRYLTEEQIFEYYLGLEVDDSIFYCNPLRHDDEAGCKYFYGSNGRLWFHDFSLNVSYDCFNVVQVKYSCNYYKACKIIAEDFNLIENTGRIITQQTFVEREKKVFENCRLLVKCKNYYPQEYLDWWLRFGVPVTKEDLLVWSIRPIDKAWLEINGNEKLFYRHHKGSNHIGFVYGLEDGFSYQFYFPNGTKTRHLNDPNTSHILQGWRQLPRAGKFVVITKSRKDAFLLSFFGIPAIAVLSENKIVKKEYMDELFNRFDYVFTLFDNDRTGRRLTILMQKVYGTISLLFPFTMEKDFSDNLLEFGVAEMADMIIWLKHKYNLYNEENNRT